MLFSQTVRSNGKQLFYYTDSKNTTSANTLCKGTGFEFADKTTDHWLSMSA